MRLPIGFAGYTAPLHREIDALSGAFGLADRDSLTRLLTALAIAMQACHPRATRLGQDCGSEPGHDVGGTDATSTDPAFPDPAPGDVPETRAGFTALVVEDNMLIAMDAEEALFELGAAAVHLCPDVASALACIRATAFDIALLDVDLGAETSEAIAITLRECGTPFIMTTGFGDYISDIPAYAGVPVLTKPYPPAALSRALSQVMR